jgi:hypothetical protein
MGTRADFYVGRGASAEWIGSMARDGYPDTIDKKVVQCRSEKAFRRAVTNFLNSRDDTMSMSKLFDGVGIKLFDGVPVTGSGAL